MVEENGTMELDEMDGDFDDPADFVDDLTEEGKFAVIRLENFN